MDRKQDCFPSRARFGLAYWGRQIPPNSTGGTLHLGREIKNQDGEEGKREGLVLKFPSCIVGSAERLQRGRVRFSAEINDSESTTTQRSVDPLFIGLKTQTLFMQQAALIEIRSGPRPLRPSDQPDRLCPALHLMRPDVRMRRGGGGGGGGCADKNSCANKCGQKGAQKSMRVKR